MEYRQKPGDEDGDSTTAVKVMLCANPLAFSDPLPEAAGADLGPEVSSEGEADTFAQQRTDHGGDDERDVLDDVRDSGARDDHHGVARHDEADQDRGLQRD